MNAITRKTFQSALRMSLRSLAGCIAVTGQKENSYIKLIYMNARWYDPQIGRFVSADTIVPQASNPQSYNRYSYVLGSPMTHTRYTSFR